MVEFRSKRMDESWTEYKLQYYIWRVVNEGTEDEILELKFIVEDFLKTKEYFKS